MRDPAETIETVPTKEGKKGDRRMKAAQPHASGEPSTVEEARVFERRATERAGRMAPRDEAAQWLADRSVD